MIISGQLLREDPSTPGAACLCPGYVRVDGNLIAEVVEEDLPASSDLGGPTSLILPGLVDTHLHLPQFDMIGAHGLPLLDWLSGVTFPMEARWADSDYAAEMSRRVAKQLFAHGTTSVCAYSSVHQDATVAAIETLAEAGVRGAVGQSLSDRFAPPGLVDEPERLLEETSELLQRYPAGSPIAAAITPRFAISCTEELLHGAGLLAKAHPEALVQTHLSETVRECEQVADLYGGADYVEVYGSAGLVTERTVFGHGIHVDAEDCESLRQAGAVVAHCPTANSFLRAGAMDRSATIASGVRMSLGSDIGAGYERSMVRVARAMIETAAAIGDDYPTPAEAWAQIAWLNADAVGFDAGRLRRGATADLVVVEPDIPWLESTVDPLATLLFAWDDRWVRQTLAGGTTVHQGG